MQQVKTDRREKIMLGIKGFFWVAGLLISGCDSDFMPWVNGIGLLLFASTSLLLGKQSLSSAIPARTSARPCGCNKSGEKQKQQYSMFAPATGL